MPTLTGLHHDVLSRILLLIHDTSRHTVFSLLLVNRALHDDSLPFVYRECTFDFNNLDLYQLKRGEQEPIVATQERLRRLNNLEPTAYILQSIRKLIICSSYSRWSDEDSDDDDIVGAPVFAPSKELVVSKWSPLMKLISRLKHLCGIVFDCREPIPHILLEALQAHHPTTHLHVRHWDRLRSDVKVGDPDEEALARCQCLRSIHAHFHTGGASLDYNLSALQRVATLAPNLESLECSLEDFGGCILIGFSPEDQQIEVEERAKFKVVNVSPRGLKSLQWPSMNIEHWQTFLDLTRLESLDCGRVSPEGLISATEHFPFKQLRKLSLIVPTWPRWSDPVETSLANFLEACPPLESLSIVNYSLAITIFPICLHQGRSLRSLSLHNVEYPDCIRYTLSLSDLQHLRSTAPLLESLELDINRTVSCNDEGEIYTLLSTFPKFHSITLHYDLGLASQTAVGDPAVYPVVGSDFAEGVWRMVEKGKEDFGTRSHLNELTLYLGEPNREMSFGYPIQWELEERSRRQKFCVRRCERDDMREQVEIQHTGPQKV